jgi:hypothetical protein
MAATFETQGHLDTGTTTTAVTLSGTPITIPANGNMALGVVLCFASTAGLPTGITVTCNGVSMAAVAGASGVNTGGVTTSIIWFALVNPTTGTPTITANWTGGRSAIMGAIAVSSVNQTGGTASFANGNYSSNVGITNPATVTITSAVGNLTAAGFCDDGGTVISSTNFTQDFIDMPAGGQCFGAMNHAAGSATSNTMTATFASSDTYDAAGFDFVAFVATDVLMAQIWM